GGGGRVKSRTLLLNQFLKHFPRVSSHGSRLIAQMARVSLIDDKAGPDAAAVLRRVRGARGGRLRNLYRALLHAPALADAWLDFNNAVRFKTTLDDRVRELAITRLAYLTGHTAGRRLPT